MTHFQIDPSYLNPSKICAGHRGSREVGWEISLRDIHKWNIMPCISICIHTCDSLPFRLWDISYLSISVFLYNFSHSNRYIEYDCTKVPLNVQGRGLALGNGAGVGLDGSGHLGAGELLDLLRSTADEGAGIEKGVQLRDDGVEEGGAADALDQVVVLTLLLDVVGSLVGEDT